MRSGAGLVTVATPSSCVPIVAGMGAEYMTIALDELPGGQLSRAASDAVLGGKHDVIAVGPGIGTGSEQQALVLAVLERSPTPVVLDADALTVLSTNLAALRGTPERPVIITPHPGEMARLTGLTVPDVQRQRFSVAGDVAMRHQVFVILKGYRTLVATPEGHVYINPTGNPGMATGGSGDVLTGMVAGWLAQGLGPAEACLLAVYLHGAAGDLAARELGEVAMTAGDILSHLGAATLALTTEQPGERGRA